MVTMVAALTLAAVLDHAGRYVERFHEQLSGIVAEERYQQDWSILPRGVAIDERDRHRVVVSDLRLILIGSDWRQIRTVREIDGRPAELGPGESVDVGDVTRTVNTPLFALKFLEPANQWRCRFHPSGNRIPETVVKEPVVPGTFRTGTEVWVVEFDEREHPTIIRDAARHSRDVPARGRFWIDAETGRVFMSEVVAESRNVRAVIDVSYQSEPMRGLLVPIEMREWYDGRKTGSRVETIARYGRFREIQE